MGIFIKGFRRGSGKDEEVEVEYNLGSPNGGLMPVTDGVTIVDAISLSFVGSTVTNEGGVLLGSPMMR